MNTKWSPTALFVRLFHTVLTIGIVTSLFFSETSLRRALVYYENLAYAVVFIVCVAFSLAMYWTACLVDPGYVPVSPGRMFADSDEDENGEISLESSQMLENGVKLRKCGFCGIVQPLRARHCEECERCVHKYDHHCPWLNACVGEKNHKFFWLFLASKSFVILWAAGIVWRSFVFTSPQWWYQNLVFIVDIFVLFLSGFVVICLLCLHTHIMCTNTTTWEMISRERITYLKDLEVNVNPFHEGYCKNMLYFLCRLSARQWDRIYNRSLYSYTTKRPEYSDAAITLNKESGGDSAVELDSRV